MTLPEMIQLNMDPVLGPRGNVRDLGKILDVTDAAVGTYQTTEILMASSGWTRLAGRMVLNNAVAKILAKATNDDTDEFVDATTELIGVASVSASGFFSIVQPTAVYAIKFEYETTDVTNTVDIWFTSSSDR